jgi:hypothetical protein
MGNLMPRIFLMTIFVLASLCWHRPQNAVAQTANSWTVPLRIKIGAADSFRLYLGVRPNATAGFDVGIDTLAAPPPPATPYAYFPLATFPNFLQADFRGAANSSSWSLRIINTGGATSTVSWNTSQVPASIPALFIVSVRDTVNMLTTVTKTYAGDQSLKISFPTPVSVASRPTEKMPEIFELRSYPNPFVATTTFEISLPISHSVALRIFNLAGQEIRALHQMPMAPGRMTIQWDGLDQRGIPVPSGVYFCRLEAGEVRVERKLYRMR